MVEGLTPLHSAAFSGHKAIVEFLVRHGRADVTAATEDGRTPLHLAAFSGHAAIAAFLIQHGARVSSETKDSDDRQTPLHKAAFRGHKAVVELLIRHNADVTVISKDGFTPLHLAAQNGHDEIVELLIECKAEVGAATNSGLTSLHTAAFSGHRPIVELLLWHGADVTAAAKDDGRTPLHLAAFKGHTAVAALLIQYGAKVTTTTKDNDGRETPLHKAAFKGHKVVVELLIQHNADVTAISKDGFTPLHFAAQNGHGEIVELLISAMTVSCYSLPTLAADSSASAPYYDPGIGGDKLWDQFSTSETIVEKATNPNIDFSAKKDDSSNTEPLKVLSIDGGGIRGLSSLLILRVIMHQLRVKLQIPELNPYQYFNLIGGTGTGGIIALMLGRLRMSVEECIHAYVDLSEHVFGCHQESSHKEIFNAGGLESAIKCVIEKKLGRDKVNDPLLDPLGDESCKTIVFTVAKNHPSPVEPIKLRTYKSRFEPAGDCTIWQATRATSATLPFLPPMKLALVTPIPVEYIDAGLGFNNPSLAILTEACRIWGDKRGEMDFSRRIGCFLSLGSGSLNVARLDDEPFTQRIPTRLQVLLNAAEVLKSIVTDTEKIHDAMLRRLSGGPRLYYRFNVEQGLQDMQFFEYEKLEQVVVDTDAYLVKKENEVKIVDCVDRMYELY